MLMNTNRVSLIALLLCGALILGSVPLEVFSDETEETILLQEFVPDESVNEHAESSETEIREDFTYFPEEDNGMTNEERFEGYVNQLFFGDDGIKPFSVGRDSAGARLPSEERLVYDALVKIVKQIADGERSSAEIMIGTDPDADVYLELSKDFFALDSAQIYEAIRMDLPYDLYWHYPYKGGGRAIISTSRSVLFKLCVDKAYQGSMFEVNTARTGAAKIAAKNAKAIVAKYDGQSDYHKLCGYKNEIIDLVTYDKEAQLYGAEKVGGGPWTVVNTFDGDPGTNIVCGGYAVSFQYLCDMGGLICFYVRGDIPQGFHAWNIVSLDGQNYHVDVCNTDTGTSGADGSYFLAGAPGSVETGYTFTNSKGHKLKYTYYQPDVELWGKEVLTLAPKSYVYTGCSHIYSSKITVAATENADGIRTYTCSKCGNSYETVIPKLNHVHVYTGSVTAPTCLEQGYTTYTCKCGDTYVDDYVAVTDHTRVIDPAVESTCYSKGLTEGAHCGECGKVLTAQKELALIPHNFVGVTCTYCGKIDNICGEHLTWHLDKTSGELTFDGYGEMTMGYNWTDYRDQIMKVTIPQGVTNICEDAFLWCGNLMEISIPDSVTSIGSDAFTYCENLRRIHLPDSISTIGPEAFFGCGVEEITIPRSMTRIEEYAFRGSNLKKINFHAGVTYIGDYAFQWSDFEEVTLPAGLTYLGTWAFNENAKLKTVQFTGSVQQIGRYAFYECESLEMMYLPDGVEEIGDYAFSKCEKLEEVYLPESLNRIGINAFQNCTNLKIIDMPETMEYIGEGAFQWCKSLESITLPDGIESIENSTFFGCKSLKRIVIPEGVSRIAKNAFSGGCYGLEEIVLPGSLKVLEGYSFRLCEGLKSIEIPEGITTISEQSFSYCLSLTELTIPNSVTYVEKDAFKGSTGLKNITFHAAPPIFDENAFSGLTTSVHYPGTPEWGPTLLQNYGGNITWIPEHEYVADSVTATCTQGGYTRFTCSDCGHSFIRDETGPIGHLMGVWVTVREMTETENGEESRSCLNCSMTESRIIGRKLPGDVDGDFRVTEHDVLYLLWHSVFDNAFPLMGAGDFTGDGSVNQEDVAYLFWHTLFPGLYPLQ